MTLTRHTRCFVTGWPESRDLDRRHTDGDHAGWFRGCHRSGSGLAGRLDKHLGRCGPRGPTGGVWVSVTVLLSLLSQMGQMLFFFNIPSALALTQILCGDTLSGPLYSAAASCGCPSTPSTSRRCSATSPAKPWDTQRCEHTCARCRFRSPLVEQSDWDKASVFHASGLCMWTWSACGSLWAWPCFLASPCSPFIRTAILFQTGTWTVRMR